MLIPLRRRAARVTAAATAAFASVALAVPAAPAQAVTLRVVVAEFEGTYAGPGRTSTSSRCNEFVTNGTGPGTFTCTVSFSILQGTDVCQLKGDEVIGLANYWSHFPEFDIKNIHMTGADASGSGAVVGTVVLAAGRSIFTIRISFAGLCLGEGDPRRFVGNAHLL